MASHRSSIVGSPARTRLAAVSRFRSILGLVLLAFVLWVLYLVENRKIGTFEVISDSMLPALKFGETWLMEPRPGRLRIGDIVVFRHPDSPETLVVKRVVALQSDRVALQAGRLLVNGQPAPPPVAAADAGTPDDLPDLPNHEWVVPPDRVFVAGDNRNDSTDSRDYGPIPIRNIIGILTRKLSG